MPKRKKSPLLIGLTARLLMLIAAGGLWLSYLSVFVNPAKAWFMTLFGLFYVPLLALNLFLLVWAAVRRSRAILIPLVALLPSLFVVGRYVQFSGPEEPVEGGIKVISYNVGRFASPARRLHLDDEKTCADSIARFLRGTGADIICLQKFHIQNPKQLKSWLASHFKDYDAEYYVFTDKRGCYGNVTLSRFPIRDKGKLEFGKSTNLALYSEYEVSGRRLRVYNCHFQSYSLSLSKLAHRLQGDTKNAIKDTETKMKTSIERRPGQVEAVLRDIEQAPVTSLIVGDFNDTPLSYTYWRLTRAHRDSFIGGGRGFGATFTRLRPLLRIDYILYPSEYQVLSHEVMHVRYSDHYPVQAILQ